MFPVGLVVLLRVQSRRCWRAPSSPSRRACPITNAAALTSGTVFANRLRYESVCGAINVYVVELFRQFWRPLPCALAQLVGEPRSWLHVMLFSVLLMSG